MASQQVSTDYEMFDPWTLAEMPFRCLVESKPKIATVTSGKLANVYLQKQN